MSYLADNIRYLRLKNDMTQEALAMKLGKKSYTTIQKWESGVAEPPIKIASQIADIFGVSLDALTNTDLQYKSEPEEHYYLDEDAREYAEFLFRNPQYKVLFDASRTVPAKDIDLVRQLIERFSDHDE